MGERIPNEKLLTAGLELMRQNGKPLTRVDSFGGSMMYKTPEGERVRVRTCNDHIIIVLAKEDAKGAKLNIEGTDYLLIVMPEAERTSGRVNAYLVPTHIAVKASRTSHQAWKDSNPNTKGDNKTWNLWFRTNGKTAMHSDYATKWAEYRLSGEAYTDPEISAGTSGSVSGSATPVITNGGFKAVIETARQMVSKAAGVPLDAVKITIGF